MIRASPTEAEAADLPSLMAIPMGRDERRAIVAAQTATPIQQRESHMEERFNIR